MQLTLRGPHGGGLTLGQPGEPVYHSRLPNRLPASSPPADASITTGRLFSPAQRRRRPLLAQTLRRAMKCRGGAH